MVSRKDLLMGTAMVPEGKRSQPGAQVGLAWYRREDYSRILDMMADRSDLHDAYDQWLLEAERLEKYLAREGHTVMRVLIDPESFRTWCEQHNLKPVASARSRFTSEAARAMSENEGGS